MSLLDIDERILEVAKVADIVRSPIVDGKGYPEVDIAVIEGAVGSDEHLEDLKKIRASAKILVSLGDCAVTGNVSSLRNAFALESVLDCAYREAESNAPGPMPGSPEIQRLLAKVTPLHEHVKIDFTIPGCPPSADLIFYVLNELLSDRAPVLEKGRLRYG
ncbi:MAG: NADP oxidoreductase [Elusimicrobia bacterium]|nr:NADP oxidoreductase [Elusimicrobiota bacterium]